MLLTADKTELNKSINFSKVTLIIFSDTILYAGQTQPANLTKENEIV
jgi:hypothetical protein